MSEPLVVMERIEKSFPGVHALEQAQFELRTGEVHALVGENGAGKSTLMKILAGIYHKDEGRVTFQGEDVNIPSPRAAQNLGISMIHQELNLMGHLAVAQNIFIGREPRQALGLMVHDKRTNDQALQYLQMLNLDLDPRTKVTDLTVAIQQMVEIAKALSFNSEVLIMDEPTAALTDAEIEDLFTIIRELRAKGVGIVYISHRLEELKQISDRITVMRDGNYVDTVNTEKATVDQIISMMVGRMLYTTSPEIPENIDQPVVLEVQNLNRGRMVRDVNFHVKAGEIVGVLNAEIELQMEGDLVIIGYDSGIQQMMAIEESIEAGAITQDPIGIGYKSVEAAVIALRGEELEEEIDTGFHWYDADNIDDEIIAPLLYE